LRIFFPDNKPRLFKHLFTIAFGALSFLGGLAVMIINLVES
jgi:hypothetical protein